MPGVRKSLDHPALAGRIRTLQSRRSTYERRPASSRPKLINDVSVRARPSSPLSKPQPKPATVHRTPPKSVPSRQARTLVLKRHLVVRPSGRRRKSVNAKGVAWTVMAAVLFIFGIGVGVDQFSTNQKAKAQVKTLAAQTEAGSDGSLAGDIPSEEKPEGGVSGYRVSPLSPRTITIQKLGVEARVLRLGVKSNNELKAPANIYDAAWYEGSAKPGEEGAVLMNGHVHGPTQPGVFFGLKKLKSGDKITIERGDGKVFSYHVVKLQTYDKDNVDMGAALSSAEPGTPGLNLITCDGEYDSSGEYNKRLLVFAVQD